MSQQSYPYQGQSNHPGRGPPGIAPQYGGHAPLSHQPHGRLSGPPAASNGMQPPYSGSAQSFTPTQGFSPAQQVTSQLPPPPRALPQGPVGGVYGGHMPPPPQSFGQTPAGQSAFPPRGFAQSVGAPLPPAQGTPVGSTGGYKPSVAGYASSPSTATRPGAPVIQQVATVAQGLQRMSIGTAPNAPPASSAGTLLPPGGPGYGSFPPRSLPQQAGPYHSPPSSSFPQISAQPPPTMASTQLPHHPQSSGLGSQFASGPPPSGQYSQNMPAGPPPLSTFHQGPPPMSTPGGPPTGPPALMQGNPMMGSMGGVTAMAPATLTENEIQAQADQRAIKLTIATIPNSKTLAEKSKLPMGCIVRPLAPDANGQDSIDVVNFGTTGIVRCEKCRLYINPFVQWIDNGRRWRCNLCSALNNVPSSYFCHLDEQGLRRDRDQRPELRGSSVEFVAPADYMVRPPQAPVYFFVIDVSVNAVQSGMLAVACEAIRESLDRLPGAPRTQIGFISYDSAVHYYNLKSSLQSPQLLVVSDIADLFIPVPDDLLVNLSDSRAQVEALLDQLPKIHQNTRNVETCLGPAIRAAFRVMAHIGGKMLLFQTQLPSLGEGTLKHRENPRIFGTDKEHTLFQSVDDYYRKNAMEFSRQQVCVDLFLFSHQYIDVATLATLPKITGGQLYYYHGFTKATHGEKFKSELIHDLTRITGWEGMLRIRCTRGVQITNFYGNYFIRGPSLLALPNCTEDSVFAADFTHSDAVLSTRTICVQAALLYTCSAGERRIRVHTITAPVSSIFADMFRSADVESICNLLAKAALDTAVKAGLELARQSLQTRCVDIIRAFRSTSGGGYMTQGQGMHLNLPENLQLLPLYTMAALKSMALRGGTDVHSDERVFLNHELSNMTVEQSRVFIYPRLFALHDMPDECGRPLKEGAADTEAVMTAGKENIRLPPVVSLSVEKLNSDGAFLLEDSLSFTLWIGRGINPSFLKSLFNIVSLEGIDCTQLRLQIGHDDLSTRVGSIINSIREERTSFLRLQIIREGDPVEARFFCKLVEDRATFPGGTYSYAEYLGNVIRQSYAAASS